MNLRSLFHMGVVKVGLTIGLLALGSSAALAQSSLTLTAAPTSTTLPDGQMVSMWGYSCSVPSDGVSCAAINPAATGWQPPLIRVPFGQPLQIKLVNHLSFSTASGAANSKVPTSLVIVGQLGGGLGTAATYVASPLHAPQGTTWPGTIGGTGPDDAVFTPPDQAARVRSFATEVQAEDSATSDKAQTLTWTNLRPGTYLLESGTQPSIQGPMGLYGVLIVTDAAGAGQAYGQTFDQDVVALLSEIDPLQNAAVDLAVRTPGFSDTTVWNGQAGQCGDPTGPLANTCYPPAVNYTPLYFLLNGVSLDRNNQALSTLAVAKTAAKGRVLLRLVNAGLRMHVPSVVGTNLTLLAEDGNQLPGVPRVQSSVFMAAGKTYDVTMAPQQPVPATGIYADATYALFDRALGLSTNNQRDGGMQAFIKVGAGAASTPAALDVRAFDDSYSLLLDGGVLTVAEIAKGVMANDIGVTSVSLLSGPSLGSVVLNPDGTFTYTPTSSTIGINLNADSFSYCANGTVTGGVCSSGKTAVVKLAAMGVAPMATDIVFTSQVAARYASPPPGVLGKNVTNSSGLPLTAVGGGGGALLNADGSFVVTGPGAACAAAVGAPTGASCVAFPYQAKNSQGSVSNVATATVVFMPASNLAVNIRDAKTGVAISDYRWIIEEDRTFWIDPKCQINSTDPAVRPASCPPLPVESLGYSFHTANMPVVAQGCVGSVSCEAGQTLGGAKAICDIGNGACRVGDIDAAAGKKAEVLPSSVYLDPTKRYFISVLPGDGVNPTVGGAGGPDENHKPFNIDKACGPYTGPTGAWEPAGSAAMCGHEMGGAQIAAGQQQVNIALQQTPLPTAKISVFVFQDDNPLNGENDAGGGVDIIAPNEAGLGGFEIKLFDQAGGLGDNTGQITYDMFNMPVSNALAGQIDPISGKNACPITVRTDGLVGMIPTCPLFEDDGKTPSPLAGQAVIANLYPGLYEIQAYPAADRIARGEEWLQTNTLDGGKPHEAFIKPNEPGYFQEFGPGGFHVAIGFANPKIINDRKAGYCANGVNCSATLNVQVTNAHMSRTPDQRTFSSETYDHYGFTQCYVSVGPADAEDFALQKCDADGRVSFTNMPVGVFKISVFDQWNDIMLDGLVSTVTIDGDTSTKVFPVTQWRTNLFTRTFFDIDGDGTSSHDLKGKPCTDVNTPPNCNPNYGSDTELGLALVNTNIRYRDGSYGFYNNTDLNGYAGFNEVFPFMNWLVVETSSTRYKSTGAHTVYDAGGPVDCSQQATAMGMPCSNIAANLANTSARVPLPEDLRVPGARYCDTADCLPGDSKSGNSSGSVFPPQAWGTTQGWQGLLGQNSFIEFGVKPFNPGENGGIQGNVIYASTRPFDDPSLSLQLQWEPGVPRVKINLYSKTPDANGNEQLKLVDSTLSTSFDDWAQGFRRDASGNLIPAAGGGFVPNMNCPGQDESSPFFATLKDSKQYLDADKNALAYRSRFKCYDGWSQLNQVQPAPYDGMYKFPSVTTVGADGKPAGTNCTGCVLNDKAAPGDWDYQKPMLPPGKYVVEVIVPPGYELVKEEDKNILLGDVYVAPVTQQFAGLGNIFIMPDQAEVNSSYNANNPGGLNKTNNLGSTTFPRHEGDTGSVEAFWPCVGAERIVPDLNSLFPAAGQAAPFAGAKRRLCDRKEVKLDDQASVLAKFYLFSSTHIAGHFTGTITNDFASEFDPFSPQFGEKFGPPNLPVGLRDFNGNEVARVYSDQWGIYNGLYFSSWSVNPPNPTGYAPQMAIACMNDPGPIPGPNGTMITDPAYNPAYSNFCYETPFMPGFTAYMDTPVIPTMAFADGYNLPDTEYPDETPAIKTVVSSTTPGPFVLASTPVASVTVGSSGANYTAAPSVSFTGGGGLGATAAATMRVSSIQVSDPGSGYTSADLNGNAAGTGVTISGGGGTGAQLSALFPVTLKVVSVTFTQPASGNTCSSGSHGVTFTGIGGATATAVISNNRLQGINVTNGGVYTSVPTVSVANCNGVTTRTARMGIGSINLALLNGGGSGYTSQPTITIAPPPAGVGNSTAAASALLSVDAVAVSNGGSGYTSAPTVAFSGGGGSGAKATATLGSGDGTGQTLTITALGAKVVQNPNFSGPNSTTAPFNQKTITRHYRFGDVLGTVALVGSDGVAHPLTSVQWSTDSITGNLPAGLPNCALQQAGQTPAKCGQLVITRGDNGKQSIDAITVTIGGSAPWLVSETSVTPPSGKSTRDYTANFGRMGFSPIQTAIDSAAPGDLIIVGPGTYRENLIMWKPVRLQGVGAAAVTINADAHPAGKMDQWRRQVNCVFGLTLDGAPTLDANNATVPYDTSGTYACPPEMQQRVDRIPFEAIVGWDASGNGNLAQVLQEPTLMGAYEGAGVTVLGRGVKIPGNSYDFWGQAATGGAGAFTDGSVYLSAGDCATRQDANGRDYGTSNFYCNPSRIDGVSIMNSSQGGGGVFVHGWAHNLEIGNTRIWGNHGTLAGAINLGNGETPDAFINDGVECGVNLAVMPCPPVPNGTALNAAIPFQFNTNVRIHHNMLYDNASIGDALFSGTPAGAGAITVSAGADGYQIDHNWIAGNLSTGDGGGLQHLGLVFNGRINNNFILFNQSTNPTLPTNGGGVVIEGANLDRSFIDPATGQLTECGSVTDQDCPPGIGEGTGKNLVIDANLILGNSAESGSGGGLRIQQVNGSELVAFPNTGTRGNPNPGSSEWYDVTITNNIIVNNVAGWDGGGVSIQDALKVSFVNNTVASNDTTASAGSLFKSLGAVQGASGAPGCKNDPTNPTVLNCPGGEGVNAHGPQPSGLVVMAHTANLLDAMAAVNVVCPAGYGYTGGSGTGNLTNADCRKLSKPILKNDLFWQNRAFSVNIVGMGSGNQSQQNLIALTPVVGQNTSGACGSGADYRDVGLRTDDVAAGLLSLTNNKLVLSNSIYSSDFQGVFSATSSNNTVGGATPVVAQYCNGARIPPENCAAQGSQTTQASCKGYNTPAGASETTGLAQVFTFNGIQPTATVDEGHNWLNLVYGPLTLSKPNVATATNAEMMLASRAYGTVQGAYSIIAGSTAQGRGTTTGVPGSAANDFFGNPRTNRNDAGAVQYTSAAFASVAPASLGFGDVRTNMAAASAPTQTLTLTAGTSALSSIAVGVSGTGFNRQGGSCGATLVAGATCSIVVRFLPTAAGAATGVVTITANAVVVGAPVPLSGNGVKVDLAVTPNPFPSFGDVFVGTTSATQLVTLTNTTVNPMNGIGFSVGAPFARSTSTPGSCGASGFALGANSSCTIGLVFKPVALNPVTGALIVTAGAGVAIDGAQLQLSGNGLLPAVTPSALDFGTTTPVGTAVLQTLTLSNATNANSNSRAFPSLNVVVSGTGYSRAAGAAGGSCAASLPAGASCTIVVQFLPGSVATLGGSVAITGNAGQTVLAPVALTGKSIPATYLATVSPATLTFAGQIVGSSSAAKSVTVSNTGNSALSGLSYTVSANFARAAGAAGGSCGNTLAVGASCTVGVQFVPGTQGPYPASLNGSLTVTASNSATITGSPVGLIGTALAPPSVRFTGESGPGSLTVATQTLNFGNNGGSNTLTLTVTGASVTFAAPTVTNTGGASQANPTPYTLGANNCIGLKTTGNTCTITVNFNAGNNATKTGTLSVPYTGGTGSPAVLNLTGN